jgi:hypothetical protein
VIGWAPVDRGENLEQYIPPEALVLGTVEELTAGKESGTADGKSGSLTAE